MILKIVLLFGIVHCVIGLVFSNGDDETLRHRSISDSSLNQENNLKIWENWAIQLGSDLWNVGTYTTRRNEVKESFKTAVIEPRDGKKILETMVTEIESMFLSKIDAVRRIVKAAENASMTHDKGKCNEELSFYDPNQPVATVVPQKFDDQSLDPLNVTITSITFGKNQNFYNEDVNVSMSSVHVPTNVNGRACDVMKDIQWSQQLDSIFVSNYQSDPTLSWQFFGSSLGFIRQFPASKWDQNQVDLFDCRLRSWYIEAADSPKDMIILVDGSMRGQHKNIAKRVVSTLLDTLTANDFVNIFKFTDQIESVVKCFNEILVPATVDNIRILNDGMESMESKKIANYSAALIDAFEILQSYRTSDEGAGCNQAIILITDGVPSNDFNGTFQQYNWLNETYRHARMFTYLIGNEVSDVQPMKEMACINQGYCVHLNETSEEVREQVIHYASTMTRPLVLGEHQHEHPIIWSNIYADIVDPKMTDYEWEIQQNEENSTQINSKDDPAIQKFNMVATVSIPVYDHRENAKANLLGVAGTDVPIQDIEKFMRPFMMGVNGYAFIVNNNGYVLTHPDHRPTIEGILKPAYNTIDILDVELLDDDSEPRTFPDQLLQVRKFIIDQMNGTTYMMVKNHMDNMKRVSRLKRQYYWTAIPNSPFTLVITYPEPYGLNRASIRYEDEIHRIHAKGDDVLSFFEGHQWRIHPDWLYCRDTELQFDTPEDELIYFLNKTKNTRWKWKGRTVPPPPPPPQHTTLCDRSLMQEVVFNAKITEWFSRNVSFNTKDGFIQQFGITTAFLATYSGLTRWINFLKSNSNYEADSPPPEEPPVSTVRSIDEVWYKRAVEQHEIDIESFVYSVPHNADETLLDTNNLLVTASHSIFQKENNKEAPVAVVGYQFQHSTLHELFKNITSNCGENCTKSCFSKDSDIECYILDDHGYVIVTKDPTHTGKFFGEINGRLMQNLVSENIYEEVNITDYQGVCNAKTNEDINPANISQAHTRLYSCDKTIKLYMLSRSIKNGSRNNNLAQACDRPFAVTPIPHSNLILLIEDLNCPVSNDMNYKMTVQAEEYEYMTSSCDSQPCLPCFKTAKTSYRRRPDSCISHNKNVCI